MRRCVFIRVAFLLVGVSQMLADSSQVTSTDHMDAPSPLTHSRAVLSIPAVTQHSVRVAYLIPSNREPQTNGIYRLQTTLLAYHAWYKDQMYKNGFGARSFRYETEADGMTPRIHLVQLKVTDAYLREDIWGHTIEAATAAGVPVWTSKQVWWLIPEAHLMGADGSIQGGTALGASNGSGDDAGVGMLGSDGLARAEPSFLWDNRNYAGLTVTDLGAFTMKQDVTFPWFEGKTLSSVASSILGAGLHELSHGFGLPHDNRNDDNMHGNLMGNGLRGWRGAIFPDRYPADYVRLSYGSALALSTSRYFNSDTKFTDTTKPTVTIQTPPSVRLTNGLLQVQFRTGDAGGLAAAWLVWKGDLCAEMPLTGTVSTQVFATPWFETGVAREYKVAVFDRQGNKTEVTRNITVAAGDNAAPQPKFKITPNSPAVGQAVSFDASATIDPDHPASTLKVEWDLDGDGFFDTTPAAGMRVTHIFPGLGTFLARCRVTDPAGAQAVSTPIGFQIVLPGDKEPRIQARPLGDGLELSWPLTPFGFGLSGAPALGGEWASLTNPLKVWGISNVVSAEALENSAFYRLAR